MNDRKTLTEIHGDKFHTPEFIDRLQQFTAWYEDEEPYEASRLGGMDVLSETGGSERLVFEDGSTITFERDGHVSKIVGEYAERVFKAFENAEASAKREHAQEQIEKLKERVEATGPVQTTVPYLAGTDEDEADRTEAAFDRFKERVRDDQIDEPQIGLTTQESETMDMSERAERLRAGKDPFPNTDEAPPDYHILDGDVLAFVGSEPDQFIGVALEEPRIAVIFTGAEKPSNARKATEYIRSRGTTDDPRFVHVNETGATETPPEERQPPEYDATQVTVNDVSRAGKCSFRTDDGAALAFDVDRGTLVLVEDGKTPDAFRALEAEEPEPDDDNIKEKADRLAELHVTKDEHESASYEITDIQTEQTEADDDEWRPQGYIAQDSTKNKLDRILRNDNKTLHIALHPDGDNLDEPDSDSYRRARIAAANFEETNGTLTNAEPFEFPEAKDEWGKITHISIYDGPQTDDDAALVVTVPLDEHVYVGPGGTVTFAVYDIEFQLP